MSAPLVDLGLDHTYRFVGWSPDRALNPQYVDVPDAERYGAFISHLKPDGAPCIGSAVIFDSETSRALEPTRPVWTVESWDPLTLSPSIACRLCGDHGYIRDDRWEPA